jgi:23S rRNA (pseudouridine1915-N3)-methyltransferase
VPRIGDEIRSGKPEAGFAESACDNTRIVSTCNVEPNRNVLSPAVVPMRVVIAAVGRLKQGPERDLAASYRKRAEATGRALGFRDIEIIEIRESRAQDAERRRIEESIAIATIIPESAVVVGLDERGETLDSAALAGLMREWRAEDRAAVCFIVGGADGLAPSLLERAQLRLAFGRATWPHQLVRIMLLEQIYRAATILAGHPYHRA